MVALTENITHGGDIYRNKVSVDFSVNINPLGIPDGVRQALLHAAGQCMHYPDAASAELVNAISRTAGIRPECVVCGNGASELFMAAVSAVMPKRVLIPVPSFYGYERASRAAGSEVTYYQMREADGFRLTEAFMKSPEQDYDLLFLADPNNPVGNMIDDELLERICDVCRDRHIMLLLDESFIEFTGRKSFAESHDISDYPEMAVIRSFTKIYAIPGVRLGCMLCGSPDMSERIRGRLPEWNISVFAQEAGLAALKERDYIIRSVSIAAAEREFLMKELSARGLRVFPGTADFLMLQGPPELYARLLERGILIRDCSNFRGLSGGFFRIAVRTHEEDLKLLEVLDAGWD